MKRNCGFTLIELLIVVAIMSTMMAIGLPSFQSIIEGSRLTSAANAMVSALQLARMEALKQHKPVVIRPKDGVADGWKQGWELFVDVPKSAVNNYTKDGDEPLFATFDALGSTLTVKASSAFSDSTYYDASGRIKSVGGSFSFCATTDFRSVIIGATGRVHVETSSNSTRTFSSECS